MNSNILALYSGILFDVTNPRPEDISETDIAHSLSLMCRANGHYNHFYSVARHCLNCANEAKARGYSRRVQLACLLHDASEAYIADITRPFKPHLTNYREFETRIQNCVYEKFGLSSLSQAELDLVFELDDSILYYEFLNLSTYSLVQKHSEFISVPEFDFELPEITEAKYLDTLKALTE